MKMDLIALISRALGVLLPALPRSHSSGFIDLNKYTSKNDKKHPDNVKVICYCLDSKYLPIFP